MTQYNYDYPNSYQIEGVEERLLDSICEILSSSVKSLNVASVIGDSYKNFTVKLSNNTELDCEIAFIESANHWEATIWEMD